MYCKNRSSYENFKLKLCTCDQSHALGKRTKFQLEILTINVIDSIVYFREIVLETSQKVSETTPWSLGPLKSNGVLVNFYLRAQWTPQNLKICNVLLQNEPLKFDSDLWKFTWWARGPGPSAKCLLRIWLSYHVISYSDIVKWLLWRIFSTGVASHYLKKIFTGFFIIYMLLINMNMHFNMHQWCTANLVMNFV